MHGVAPQMCRQVARPLLGGEARGRCLGFLLRCSGFPIAVSGSFLQARKPQVNDN
jgi:hypothetical protein